MADKGAEMDYPAHERGYASFISLVKWSAIGCFIIAGIIILLISRG